LGLIAALSAGSASTTAQTADVVAEVREAMARRGFMHGEEILNQYRSAHGLTPEAIEALSWLAQGALAAKALDKANQYATDTYDQTVTALKSRSLEDDAHLQAALGSAIEIQALVLVEQDARSDAVYLLRRELETYRRTPIHDRIQVNLNLLSLEGRPAPRLEAAVHLGLSLPSMDELKGKVVLLFFWAHWCAECKAESPIIAKLLDKYRSQGLAIVAPTRRYGYVAAGRPAAPDRELRHIMQVRDNFYGFLRHESVPVSGANYRHYGVASIPMLVLLDRQGIVRLYHPGQMTEEELDAAIRPLL
jgi:thiol-disulfide isomerase/thioredoxin